MYYLFFLYISLYMPTNTERERAMTIILLYILFFSLQNKSFQRHSCNANKFGIVSVVLSVKPCNKQSTWCLIMCKCLQINCKFSFSSKAFQDRVNGVSLIGFIKDRRFLCERVVF